MSIQVKDVSKFFGSQEALKKVSFEIKSGEIVGFIGPNGAGKSTMMKIITGCLPQSEGEVTVCGESVVDSPLHIKKKIGYLPENNPLYLSMYIKEYLEYIAGLYQIQNKINSRVNEIIQLTGLEAERNKKIGALSKGYRQRVGLAQALIHDPEVLILDEPTTGLDPNQILEIRGLIKATGQNKTVLLSTHIMQEVEAICHRIIVINKGTIVIDGQTGDVQKNNSNIQTIIVEFNNTVEKSQLLAIECVENIVSVNANTWLLETSKKTDLRELVFKFAVQNNVSILSMQKKEKKLEDVFRELTQN